MTEEKKDIKKRSERMVKLFNAVIGKNIGSFPGPIPPFSKWLNGKLISAERGEVEIEHEIRQEWGNPTGLIHGGMIGALIDDTIGMCTATLGYEGFLITINSNINYLGKAKIGEKLLVKANLVREGKTIIHFFSQISDLKGNLIASGNANLLKTHYKPDYIKAIDNYDGQDL